jgi:hypothetical protein
VVEIGVTKGDGIRVKKTSCDKTSVVYLQQKSSSVSKTGESISLKVMMIEEEFILHIMPKYLNKHWQLVVFHCGQL